jgi:hypothetical protein
LKSSLEHYSKSTKQNLEFRCVLRISSLEEVLVDMRERKPGRPCSICEHEQLEKINELLETKTYRAVSRQILGNDSMRDSLRRHERNCLGVSPTTQKQASKDILPPTEEKVSPKTPSEILYAMWVENAPLD